MSGLIQWESVCLVCLQKGENRCIFGEDNDSIVIADKIMTYSDILIKRDTNQPKSICLQCLDDLNVAYKFHRNYEQAESIIKALLNTNHQEFQIKDLWKTSSPTVNPFIHISIKDEVVDNAAVVDCCVDTPRLDLDDADTESKPIDRADSYVHGNATERNNVKIGQNNKFKQTMNSKIARRSTGRRSKLSEESSLKSGYKRSLKHRKVRPKESTGMSLKICEICNHGFRYQYVLDNHMRRHTNERPFSCDHCDKTFVIRGDLRRHVRVHTGEKPYKCQYCDLRFSSNEVKKNHESEHTGVKPYKCPTCDKSFGYAQGLKWHLLSHNKFSCKECGKEFIRKKPFQEHVNRHLNRDELNESSGHTQKKSLEKEIFQIQENTNSSEIIIKHEIAENDLISDNCDIVSTLCIDEEYGTVSETTNREIQQQSNGEMLKHPRVRPKQPTGLSSRICEICNHGFRDQNALDVHMRRHNNERPFSCNHCDKAFVTRAILRCHVRTHTGEKPYKCQYCDLRFSSNAVKKNHENKHTGKKPFKCPTCEKSYGYSKGLIIHLRLNNKCGKEFIRKKPFEKHVNRHLNRDELNESSGHTQTNTLEKEIFQIQENTTSNEIIIKHEIVENDLIGDNCDIGSTVCIDEEYVTVSETTIREILQQSNGEMLKHHRVRPKQSTGVSLRICEICKHGFRDQSALDVHTRRHNNERPFSCDKCDKAFVTRAALRCHVRTHTGEKPYKCQYCDLRFSDISVKKNHESKHTGVKPYKCPTCDKSFGYSKGLISHLRIHNGENKFTCKECGKVFRRKVPFERHLAHHLTGNELDKSS